ncbi:asparagine synthase-related protein [Emticicia sp. TH156]|uniref:asparagine synthase-related protein n=1 Tax=Emticicia sp. TH156 TaxID=2067454 RepID=UPI000C787A56|nr:asparagine synthase-related protein [Emticicia sp. TH156]PLK46305.1 hypothetical protein C0V77_02890 [Emticicia sp. TH156]
MGLIFGRINKTGKKVDETILEKVFQSVSRITPDEGSSWTDTDIVLGNTHLIEDAYPYLAHLIITADARIDNRPVLASMLGNNVNLLNDAQLILMTFYKWGEKCVQFLEGEFAFVIWNKASHELFAAADPVGHRPLYYYDSGDEFIFCNEIKGVTAVKQTPDIFNEDALIDYFFKKGLPGHTYNQEVFSLCGGNILTLKHGKVGIKKYWRLQASGKYSFKKEQDWYDCLLHLVYNAVEKRLDYERPVGLTLSGGLDSSCLAFVLSDLLQKRNKPLYTFSSVLPVGYEGIARDERKYIESIGRRYPNIIQNFVDSSEIGSIDSLNESFLLDESIPNPFHYLDKAILSLAREKKVHTLFTGYGGDFGVSWKGDSVVYQLIYLRQFKEALQLVKEFGKRENLSMLQVFVKKFIPHTELYRHLRPLLKMGRINWQNETTLKNDFVKKYSHRVIEYTPLKDFHSNAGYQINEGRFGKITAMFHTRNAAFGIESAVPYLDKSILEFLMDIPLPFFVKGGIPRSLIRNIMKGNVPDEITRRMDKLPYSPGYQNKIKSQKSLLQTISSLNKYEFIFDKYLDKHKIINNFINIKPEEGFTPAENIVGIRLMQAVNAAVVISRLKEENYHFKFV